MKFHRAAVLAIPRAQGEATSQVPRIMLIHSSQSRKTDNSTTSTRIIRRPSTTALRTAVGSYSKNSAQGESRSEIPRIQLAQSSHCLGNDSSFCVILHARPGKDFSFDNIAGRSHCH